MSEAQRLTARYPNASAVVLDVNDSKKVSDLVEEADVIIRYALQNNYVKGFPDFFFPVFYLFLSTHASQICVFVIVNIW